MFTAIKTYFGFTPNHLNIVVSLRGSGEKSFSTTGFCREISKQPQLSLWWCFHSIGCRSRRDSLTRCGIAACTVLTHERNLDAEREPLGDSVFDAAHSEIKSIDRCKTILHI